MRRRREGAVLSARHLGAVHPFLQPLDVLQSSLVCREWHAWRERGGRQLSGGFAGLDHGALRDLCTATEPGRPCKHRPVVESLSMWAPFANSRRLGVWRLLLHASAMNIDLRPPVCDCCGCVHPDTASRCIACSVNATDKIDASQWNRLGLAPDILEHAAAPPSATVREALQTRRYGKSTLHDVDGLSREFYAGQQHALRALGDQDCHLLPHLLAVRRRIASIGPDLVRRAARVLPVLGPGYACPVAEAAWKRWSRQQPLLLAELRARNLDDDSLSRSELVEALGFAPVPLEEQAVWFEFPGVDWPDYSVLAAAGVLAQQLWPRSRPADDLLHPPSNSDTFEGIMLENTQHLLQLILALWQDALIVLSGHELDLLDRAFLQLHLPREVGACGPPSLLRALCAEVGVAYATDVVLLLRQNRRTAEKTLRGLGSRVRGRLLELGRVGDAHLRQNAVRNALFAVADDEAAMAAAVELVRASPLPPAPPPAPAS